MWAHARLKVLYPWVYLTYIYCIRYWKQVIFVLMLLRAINGDRMMFIRGNHEDMNMCMRYGLAHEVSAKYQQERELVLGRLLRLFQLFPVGIISIYHFLTHSLFMCFWLSCYLYSTSETGYLIYSFCKSWNFFCCVLNPLLYRSFLATFTAYHRMDIIHLFRNSWFFGFVFNPLLYRSLHRNTSNRWWKTLFTIFTW